MSWIIVVIIAATALFFVLKSRAQPSVRQNSRTALSRAGDLPREDRAALARELRSAALHGYDVMAAAAKRAGKNDAFAHQAGVLQALTAVVSPGCQPNTGDQRELQMETVPFNKFLPADGRAAIVEYLVWKFFPEHAEEDAFAPVLRRFRYEVCADEEEIDDVIFKLLYSGKYDWQRWLAEHRNDDVN